MIAHALSHFTIAHQYVMHARFAAAVRPYRVVGALSPQVELFLDTTPLPEAQHHQVVLSARVIAKDAQGAEAYRVEAAIEAIVLVGAGMSEETLATVLRVDTGAALLGSMRTLLSTLLMGTGFPALLMPPLAAAAMARLQGVPALEHEGAEARLAAPEPQEV